MAQVFSAVRSWLVLMKGTTLLSSHTMPFHVDLVSDLQDQDVVRLAKQQCGISKTLHTPSFPVIQRGHPFSHFKVCICRANWMLVEGVYSNWIAAKINLNLNMYSLNCEEEIWEIWASWNLAPLLQMLKCSTPCCYDNLIIVYHGCTIVCLPLWASGKIMCECEVVLFGQVSNACLWEKWL